MKSKICNNFWRGPTKFQQKFEKVPDIGVDKVKVDVSKGI
jgi:hypothetical protein